MRSRVGRQPFWLLTVNSVSVCQGACGLEAAEAMLEQAFTRALAQLCPGDPCAPVDEMQAPQTPSPVKSGRPLNSPFGKTRLRSSVLFPNALGYFLRHDYHLPAQIHWNTFKWETKSKGICCWWWPWFLFCLVYIFFPRVFLERTLESNSLGRNNLE